MRFAVGESVPPSGDARNLVSVGDIMMYMPVRFSEKCMPEEEKAEQSHMLDSSVVALFW